MLLTFIELSTFFVVMERWTNVGQDIGAQIFSNDVKFHTLAASLATIWCSYRVARGLVGLLIDN